MAISRERLEELIKEGAAEEQLEKVKECAKNIEEHIYNMYDNTNVVSDYHYAKLTVISNILKFVDNQIKQIKEGK